ncbi:hypothetical protein QYF36_018093 [Acer negundo]|nr:hypothetical protein QYF36_018093 [Acer negundo]
MISICLSHKEVRRVPMDNTSSADILSLEVFDQLGVRRNNLQSLTIPLRGFGGAKVQSSYQLKSGLTSIKIRSMLYENLLGMGKEDELCCIQRKGGVGFDTY